MGYILPFLFLISFISNSFSFNKINYLDPKPGAGLVSMNNTIAIGFENRIELNESEIQNSITVKNPEGKIYYGNIKICENGAKIILIPENQFSPGEKITVTITGKLLKAFSPEKKHFSYSFTTSAEKIQWDPLNSLRNEIRSSPDNTNYGQERDLPLSLPTMTVLVNNNPTNGNIFLVNFKLGTIFPNLIITDKNGILYWYSQRNVNCYDFKKQPNGYLTYYDLRTFMHYEMDINYNIIDSFYCGNGYTTDLHELRLLSNGHALLMAYDPEYVDMSLIVPGGNPHALVTGLIVQELDENKNVVFQWRSWDHFAITDALHENLLAQSIDYVHGNAIEQDNDGNIIISSRHLDEITKISRTTGDIIWRFGGLHNQFTFTGDTLKFTYQHAIRRIENGNLTLFDNGNFHTPHYSRAVEYSVDEVNKTANVVWEYRHTPDIFGSAMGYVQRLSNGNTLISWGMANPTVTEVTPNKTVVYEMTLPQTDYCYRVYKYDWAGNPLDINKNEGNTPESFQLKQNFPNPFNPSTEITYRLPKRSYVKLSVIDVLGNVVAVLVNQNQNPDTYKVEWNAMNFPSGVYFCKLQAGEFTAVKKLVLLK